jgi:hypothetical protein
MWLQSQHHRSSWDKGFCKAIASGIKDLVIFERRDFVLSTFGKIVTCHLHGIFMLSDSQTA